MSKSLNTTTHDVLKRIIHSITLERQSTSRLGQSSGAMSVDAPSAERARSSGAMRVDVPVIPPTQMETQKR